MYKKQESRICASKTKIQNIFFQSLSTMPKQISLEQISELFNVGPAKLVDGFNPFEKYARQNGNLPQVGVKIKNVWNLTTT